MALVRWDPARELASMEVDRLNHMFSNFYGEGFSRNWVPAVDIYETPQHEVVIKTIGERLKSIPGVAGATEIGEGEIVLVVDVASLIEAFGGKARDMRAKTGLTV